MKRKTRAAALAANGAMLVIGLYAILHMAICGVSVVLVSSGWQVLAYFTVDSNLLLLISSGLILLRLLRRGDEPLPRWLLIFRSAATSGTTLTFLVVMCYLGVIHGYGKVLSGENLYLHLVLPLLGIVSNVFFEQGKLPLRGLWWSFVPPVIYGIVTILRVLNGAAPPYPFMDVIHRTVPRTALAFFLLAAACYGSAFAVWAARKRINSKTTTAGREDQ